MPSIEQVISGPGLLLLSAKCLSTIEAPTEIAPMHARLSLLWSDKPTTASEILSSFSSRAPNLISLSGVGYTFVQ